MNYPKDDNGDALRRLEAQGDDLSRARDIDFTVVFSNDSAAREFAHKIREAGYSVSIRFTQVKESHPWDVVVVKNMIPSHAGISAFEQALQEIADTMDGYNDGWGCFSQPGKHLQ